MKVEKKVWIAKGKNAGNNTYLYDKKLSAGENGVYVGDIDETKHYLPSGNMIQLHSKELQILGIDIQPGQVIELTVAYDKPRPMGWYPITLNDGEKRMHYWDGKLFRSGRGEGFKGEGASWYSCEYSWVSDTPIPDPFKEVQ